jgi:hypothetical protein
MVAGGRNHRNRLASPSRWTSSDHQARLIIVQARVPLISMHGNWVGMDVGTGPPTAAASSGRGRGRWRFRPGIHLVESQLSLSLDAAPATRRRRPSAPTPRPSARFLTSSPWRRTMAPVRGDRGADAPPHPRHVRLGGGTFLSGGGQPRRPEPSAETSEMTSTHSRGPRQWAREI